MILMHLRQQIKEFSASRIPKQTMGSMGFALAEQYFKTFEDVRKWLNEI